MRKRAERRDALLEQGGETYQLTHDGKTVTFTAGAKQEDISEILA